MYSSEIEEDVINNVERVKVLYKPILCLSSHK